ncbi:hypothetical protein BDK92_7256 [Micromonospora pisi]|uniref:Uncharacterized protein n=1 Tax=Micromonospora pisi TaxID=589240 RepID=A0A495JUU4_9ACTN|nr:hypothetical protein [Micromonospora pisi]RKR92776.1 hypothetical protein BDK92_7256 [Micromonospora pisi]
MAAPTYVAATSASSLGGTTAAITLPDAGAGAQAGHLAVLAMAISAGLPTNDMAAAGWAALPGTPTVDTASSGNFLVWTKTLASGDVGASVSFTIDSSSRVAIGCVVVTSATVVASAVDETNSNGTVVTAPSVAPVPTSTLLVAIHGVILNVINTTATWTADAATTERVDVCSTSTTQRNTTMLIATQELTAAGPTGTRVATASATVQRQGVSLALAGLNLAAAALAASSTLTATAVRVVPAAAGLVSATTATAAPVVTRYAAAALVGSSTLTAAGARQQEAAAHLSASFTLGGTGTATMRAAAALAASSVLTATAALNHFAAADLSAGSVLTAAVPEHLPQYRPGVHTASSSRPSLTATTSRG